MNVVPCIPIQVVGHGLTVHRDSVLTEVEGDHTVLAYTWGIGGPRVGRPKNSEATPARPVEGLSPTDSVVHISASGHSALVTNAGRYIHTLEPGTVFVLDVSQLMNALAAQVGVLCMKPIDNHIHGSYRTCCSRFLIWVSFRA